MFNTSIFLKIGVGILITGIVGGKFMSSLHKRVEDTTTAFFACQDLWNQMEDLRGENQSRSFREARKAYQQCIINERNRLLRKPIQAMQKAT